LPDTTKDEGRTTKDAAHPALLTSALLTVALLYVYLLTDQQVIVTAIAEMVEELGLR
jgi:hypothetical protein